MGGRAEVLATEGAPHLRIVGVRDTYQIDSQPPDREGLRARLRDLAGRTVSVEGVIPPPDNGEGTAVPLIRVTALNVP